MSIFISICSFCDTELIPTIENLINNAKHPEKLIFGICLQDKQENLNNFKYEKDPRFKIKKVLPEDSKGCCWSRSEIQKFYKDEKYYMQLDSHHRFIKNWDELCIKCLEMCPSKKPILSTYLNMYEPGKPIIINKPYKMTCEKFYDNHKIIFVPQTIRENYSRPQLWYLMSGHFIFTYGNFVQEVPYDYQIYFDGEEDLLSLRAWTNGWDIYYPHTYIGAHYYIRKNAPRHSDFNREWYKLNDISIEKMKKIYGVISNNENFGIYGLGKKRTLEQYEEFTGINFKYKTLNNKPYKLWKYHDGYFLFSNGEWTESTCKFIYHFEDSKIKTDGIILYDKSRNLSVKLESNKAYFSIGKEPKDWTYLVDGEWSRTYKKIGIVTLYTPNQENFAIHSRKNQEFYANKYDYQYYCYTHSLVDDSIPTWNKVLAMKNHIKDHKYLVWLDSDIVITNLDIKIEDIIKKQPNKDLLICDDINPGWRINSGVIILKNTQWSIDMLDRLWKMEHLSHSQGAEQAQLIKLLEKESKERYHIFHRSEFNSHPKEHKSGNFILHMMGYSYEDRQNNFITWNKKLGIEI